MAVPGATRAVTLASSLRHRYTVLRITDICPLSLQTEAYSWVLRSALSRELFLSVAKTITRSATLDVSYLALPEVTSLRWPSEQYLQELMAAQ
jgi:hypothetical protein